MKKYKTIMELIFIFFIPLILIACSLNLKEKQITTTTGYEWNTYLEYENKILINMGDYKNVIQDFNKWDEIWENGYYNNNGTPQSSSNVIRSKNYIEVLPDTNYYFYSPYNALGRILFYDNDKTLITTSDNLNLNPAFNRTITTPTNCYYIKFSMSSGYGGTYKNNICINISVNWANGNYVQHGEPLILYSQSDISGQNTRIYTPFGAVKNLILNNFKIQQNTTTDILFDYTILWFLMFILWHVLYLFFDMLIHLFVDWGHKEKEKING